MSVRESLSSVSPGLSKPGLFLEGSPVDRFDLAIVQFRSFVREQLPFTFIAYRSLIPGVDDDWYYLSEKVAWFVVVIFNFVDFAMKTVSPFFFVIPFIPLILDSIWIGSRYLKLYQPNFPAISAVWLKSIQAIGFVAFSAIGVAFLFQKARPS